MRIPSPPDITLWHNPACSKSRKAKEVLEHALCKVTERAYLDDPPSVEELRQVLALLGCSAAAIVRKGEPAFDELGLAGADDATLLEAMSAHPILIQRPIAIATDRNTAALGRPMGEMVLAVIKPPTPEGMTEGDVLRAVAQGKLGR